MNIRDLEYLVALAKHKHFHKAAHSCNVSQPTLSGQIRKLEHELGTTLLERTSRKVLFTQAGLNLVSQAAVILQEVKTFREMASNQGKEMEGPINIGVIPTLAPYLLPKILTVLQKRYPKLSLHIAEMSTDQITTDLESGRLDCALLSFCEQTSPFIELPLFEEAMGLGVHKQHPWAHYQSIDASQLEDQTMLLIDDTQCLHEQTLRYCRSLGTKVDPHIVAHHLETLKKLIAAGMGISLIPSFAQSPDDDIVYLNIENPQLFRTIGLVYRPGSPLRNRYERLAQCIKSLIE